MNDLSIVRMPAVVEMTSLSRTTIWRLAKNDEFPPPLQIGGSNSTLIGWRRCDIEKWLAELEPAA